MQETPDKTGLLLELPKFRKSSKASQDDQESNESFSSGFRSGPESEGKVQLASRFMIEKIRYLINFR